MIAKITNEIVIVHYYKSIIDGVMTSLIDLYFNLKNKFNVKMVIICPEFYLLDKHEDYYNFKLNQTEFTRNGEHIEYEDFILDNTNEVTSSIPFLKFNRNFGDPKLFFSIVDAREYDEIEITAKTMICSSRLLYEKIISKVKFDFRISNLIVLDSLDLHKSNIKTIPNLDWSIPKPIKKCFYLSNPSNFISGKNNVEYYHKFSKKRLETVKDLKEILEYKRLGKEKIKVKDYYFENIGKGIFEHLYHKKKVNYYKDGLSIKDGLYHYLKLFNIDAFEDHLPLNITKKEIEDKLFMKNDDEIIKILELL